MTYTSSPITIYDYTGSTTKQMQAYTDGTNLNFAHSLLDGTGALVTTSNGLPVNLAQVGASALALGAAVSASSVPVVIASDQAAVSTTTPGFAHLEPSITVTAGAYTSGNVVGGLISISNAARINAGSGTILEVGVTVKTALTAPYDVIFFDTNPTNSTFTDNAALAVAVGDLPYICGVVHCNDLVSLGTPQLLQSTNIQIPFALSASAKTLYAVIVIRGGQTYASTSAVGLNVLIAQN